MLLTKQVVCMACMMGGSMKYSNTILLLIKLLSLMNSCMFLIIYNDMELYTKYSA